MLLAQGYLKMMKYHLTGLNVDVRLDNYNHCSFQQQPLIFPGESGMLTPQQHLHHRVLPVVPLPAVALPS